jgi:hypothetical protein
MLPYAPTLSPPRLVKQTKPLKIPFLQGNKKIIAGAVFLYGDSDYFRS